MPGPTPHSLTQFFTALAGREVNFALAASTSAAPKAPLVYGLYTVLPDARTLVVRMNLQTLALLGSALLGLPGDVAMERATQVPIDEPMRDAMHEVLNITSTAVTTEGRVVFKEMGRDLKAMPAETGATIQSANRRLAFNVNVSGEYTDVFNVFE